MPSAEEKLRSMGVTLPDVLPPVVAGYVPAFAPYVRTGSHIHISGRLAKRGQEILIGKIGGDLTLEHGKAAARDVAVELLAVLKHAAGGLDRVSRIVKLFVMVNGAPGFTQPHRIVDGASELLVEVLGEPGRHARSAMVAADLPFGSCLEIELIAEVLETGP
jgi:enamine deaminase RidA (YjgF/YER057c/UK114 family)